MKLRAHFLIFILLFHAVSSIHCYYCLNCTSALSKRTLQQCSYKFTHCAAVQISVQKRVASLFVCGLSRTCNEHFTNDAFEKVSSCYICDQDYCNAFMDVPFLYTSGRSHCHRKLLIAFCYTLSLLFTFLIMK